MHLVFAEAYPAELAVLLVEFLNLYSFLVALSSSLSDLDYLVSLAVLRELD